MVDGAVVVVKMAVVAVAVGTTTVLVGGVVAEHLSLGIVIGMSCHFPSPRHVKRVTWTFESEHLLESYTAMTRNCDKSAKAL